MSQISDIIVKAFISKKDFALKCMPVIRKEYFLNLYDSNIIKYVKGFYEKYDKLPTYSVLRTLAQREKSYNETALKEALERIDFFKNFDLGDISDIWLIEQTEEFFQSNALKLGLEKAINHVNSKNEWNNIPTLIEDALAISLDSSIGHDYFNDADKQFEFYQSNLVRYPTHLSLLNKSTAGGFVRKKLNVFMGSPGVGKSQMLIDLSAHYLREGMNVVYISLELDEHTIRQRCDANLMNVVVNDFPKISREKYYGKLDELKSKKIGNFMIKEYPTAGANVLTFKNLLNEIYQRKKWKPDVLMIDYLGCVLSLRDVKNGNMYLQGKYVAEEIRGLIVEWDLIGFSPVQINRSGYNKLDADMSNVAESAGIAHVADYMALIGMNDEISGLNQRWINTVKNRLNKLEDSKSYPVGYDSSHMRFFDIEDDIGIQNDDLKDNIEKVQGFKKHGLDFKKCDISGLNYSSDSNLNEDLIGE